MPSGSIRVFDFFLLYLKVCITITPTHKFSNFIHPILLLFFFLIFSMYGIHYITLMQYYYCIDFRGYNISTLSSTKEKITIVMDFSFPYN